MKIGLSQQPAECFSRVSQCAKLRGTADCESCSSPPTSLPQPEFLGDPGLSPTMMSRRSIRSLVRVYHKDENGVLYSLDSFDLCKSIRSAMSRGKRSITTQSLSSGDLKRLNEIGLQTERKLDLVLELPWNTSSLMAAMHKANCAKLQRQVLQMAVERIRREENLSKMLALKGISLCAVQENPYIRPGHLPFENFIESLLAITDATTNDGKELLELLLETASDEAEETTFTAIEERGVRMVFHGTNHDVMDAIMKSGLDPALRRVGLTEDYFGVDYGTSLRYTKHKTSPPPIYYKLLVFLIIVQQSGPLPSDGAVTVASNKFELPLAEITLLDEEL